MSLDAGAPVVGWLIGSAVVVVWLLAVAALGRGAGRRVAPRAHAPARPAPLSSQRSSHGRRVAGRSARPGQDRRRAVEIDRDPTTERRAPGSRALDPACAQPEPGSSPRSARGRAPAR